jgi:hypothetical protein
MKSNKRKNDIGNDLFGDYVSSLYFSKHITIEEYDRLRGYHLGYDKCCVDFYIETGKQHFNVSKHSQLIYGKDICKPGYVRCPICRKTSYEKK